ncbi:glycosyltransferase family 2 protein [Acaryochloris sp. IP29b_bin.148]|uniref:glycosyltransferase family 2 protein n=1 Tax=Acaryochloris sp. IP29b_bin.148 TaxID=2969218 RepID=UPI0026292A60|nr:glycosyltransferase family 2 protein [Acaryochloris sp. IP29b_bin.148]
MKISLSVVITCYREGPLILEAIESIRQQTHPPLEIIIVNDASPEEITNSICHQLEVEPDIQVVWQHINGGPSLARNAGFKAAQGDVLVPLDADDLLPENALSLISKAFENSPDAGFVYGPYYRQDDVEQIGQLVCSTDISLSTQLAPKPWSLSTNWKLLGTTPLRKSIWTDVGGYDPTFETDDLHDVEFWIRVLASGCGYSAVDDPIYVWRKYLGSNSSKVTPYAWYRIVEKYFDVYQKCGLTYRAHELLLLGSKWLNRPKDVTQHSRVLVGMIRKERVRLSTIVSLVMPSMLLRWLVTRAQEKR